jgi:hypothetical protein
MKLKKLWCVLFIMAFSMPALAVTPVPPYQIASFDDIEAEGWVDDLYLGYMLQEVNEVNEGAGSMKIAFSLFNDVDMDIWPTLALVSPNDLNLSDYQNLAITLWVWRDPNFENDNISYLSQIILYDDIGHVGRYNTPVTNAGWQKVSVNLDEFAWYEYEEVPVPPEEANWVSITQIALFVSCWNSEEAVPPYPDVYMDDLQVDDANHQPVLSDARIVNADFGTITVDGNAADWEALDDSDVVDFDLNSLPTHENGGNLHVQYRLAWDANFLYILVEELPGDLVACEANQLGDYGELWSLNDQLGGDVYYDELALYFDFTNDHANGTDTAINLWLFLGLASHDQTNPLMMAWTNGEWDPHKPEAITNGSVATSGTLGNRITEAKVSWSDLDSAIWRRPEGGFAAAVKPGYIFGCDPRLNDLEYGWDATDEAGSAWLNGKLWSEQPTGTDTYSIDVRLVCSAGDLDGDCDVDFVDYAQFAEEWLNSGCTNLNGFCNGADIVINGEVNMEDLAKFTQRWLD